jgi:hypothetical protein
MALPLNEVTASSLTPAEEEAEPSEAASWPLNEVRKWVCIQRPTAEWHTTA